MSGSNFIPVRISPDLSLEDLASKAKLNFDLISLSFSNIREEFARSVGGVIGTQRSLGSGTSGALVRWADAYGNLTNSLLSDDGATVTVGGNLLLNGDPSLALHAATKQYVDNVAVGLKFKEAVAAKTTGNITLSGEQTIDGVATSGSRILVANQTAASENGIYVSSAGAWSRSADMNDASEIPGAVVFVSGGTAHANEQWVVSTPAPITLGVTNIAWALFFTTEDITATAPLDKTGNILSLQANGISNAYFRQSSGLSVVGRASNSTGDVADITAGTDAHVLRRSGTTIGFGTIGDDSISSLAWSKLTGVPTTLSGYGITDAVPSSRTISTTAPITGGGALSGNLTLSITTNGIGNTLLRQGAAYSVIGNGTSALGDVADIVAGTDGFVLRRSGTTLGFGTIGDGSISALAWSKLFGTPTTLSGYGITDAQPLDADLTAVAALSTTGYARRSGANTWVLDATVPWGSVSGTPTTLAGYGITDGQPLDTDLTEIAAVANVRGDLLVTNSTANWSRVAVGGSGTYLRSDGTDPSWSAVQDADLPSTIVRTSRTISTTAPLSGGGDLSANRMLSITTNGIGNTLIRQSAGLSVIGRSANTTGDVADITAGTDAHVLRRSGTTLGFGTIGNASIADLAWSKLTGTPTTLAGYGITDAASSGRTISTTTPLSGGGDLSANRTFSIGGLSSLGSANQLVGVNAAGTGWEYKTLVQGSANRVTVSHASGSITLSAPQDIHTAASPTFAGMTLSGLTSSGTRLVTTSSAGVFGIAATIGNSFISDLAWSKLTGVSSASPTFSGLTITGNTNISDLSVGSITGAGDWIFTNSTHMIRSGNLDGADQQRLLLLAGGAEGPGRGAGVHLYGNDYATSAFRGLLYLTAGNVSGTSTNGAIYMATGGLDRARIEQNGDFYYTGNFMGVGPNLSTAVGEAFQVGKNGVGSLAIMQGDANGNNNLVWHFRHTDTPSAGQTGQAIDHYYEMQGFVSGVEAIRRAARVRIGKEGDFTTESGINSYYAIYTVGSNSEVLGFYQNRNGEVGIGTTSPDYRLDVREGDIGVQRTSDNAAFRAQAASNTAYLGVEWFINRATLGASGSISIDPNGGYGARFEYFGVNDGRLRVGGDASDSLDSTLESAGSFSAAVLTTSSTPINLGVTNHTVFFTGASQTCNLPSAGGCQGRIYHLVLLNTSGTLFIDSVSDIQWYGVTFSSGFGLPAAAGTSDLYGITVQSDGAYWQVIGTAIYP